MAAIRILVQVCMVYAKTSYLVYVREIARDSKKEGCTSL